MGDAQKGQIAENAEMRDSEQSYNDAEEMHYKPERTLIQRKIAVLSLIGIM
jgi:hypothetical protein